MNPVEAALKAQSKKDKQRKREALKEELAGTHRANMAAEEVANMASEERNSKASSHKREKKVKRGDSWAKENKLNTEEEKGIAPAESYESGNMAGENIGEGVTNDAEQAASQALQDEDPEVFFMSRGEDAKASVKVYQKKVAHKDGAASRVRMFIVSNMFEDAATTCLNYALDNPMEKESVLARRYDLLQALYYLRHVSDVDDDFTMQEFEAEMSTIKGFRSKMQRLAAKEDVVRDSDESDSSDDTDGDTHMVAVLKDARKAMQYAFGTQVAAIEQKNGNDEE